MKRRKKQQVRQRGGLISRPLAVVLSAAACLLVCHRPESDLTFSFAQPAFAQDHDKAPRGRERRRRDRRRKPEVREAATPEAIGQGKASHQAFNAELHRPEGIDAVLVLDASRSMVRTDPKRLRDQGAKLFLRFLTKSDRLAVVQFDRDDAVVHELSDVDTKDLRKVDKAIGDIPAEGGFTNIQAPLETALEMLRKNGRKSATKTVILLSDGKLDPHPKDGSREEVADQLFGVDIPGYKREGIRIYTLAFSADADRELLGRLATATGGLHWFTPDAETIHQKFSDLFLALKKPQVVEMKGGGFEIDPSVTEATFYITRKPRTTADVELIDPKGAKITSIKLPIGVKWFKGEHFDIVTIDAPEPGNWIVEGVEDPQGFATLLTDLELQVRWPEQTALSVGDRISVAARLTEKGEVFNAPELQNVLFYGYKLEDAESGAAKGSGTLNDLGKDGDEKKGDKIYSGTIHVDTGGELRAIVGVTGPTFSRQQQFLFSAKGAQVELVLQEADEFAKTPERLKITIANDLVRLRDLSVSLIAQREGDEQAVAIEAERSRTSRTEYFVNPELLEAGEYELFAQVVGTNKGEKEQYASSRLNFTGTGEAEPEVHEEPYLAYIIALALAALWSGALAYLFLVRQSPAQAEQIKSLPAYSHPDELRERLDALKERASESARKPGEVDKLLVNVEALAAETPPNLATAAAEQAENGRQEGGEGEAGEAPAAGEAEETEAPAEVEAPSEPESAGEDEAVQEAPEEEAPEEVQQDDAEAAGDEAQEAVSEEEEPEAEEEEEEKDA